jgi:broad specificity phosphatase PhoE
MSLLLVRHGSAGKSDEWKAADAERPLDERGEEQAAHLPDVLARFPIERILSSPAKRCLDTVGPLAAARGLTVEPREELSPERQDRDGHILVRSLAGQNVIVCGHGGLETVIAGAPRWRKGTTFVVDDNLHVESIF